MTTVGKRKQQQQQQHTERFRIYTNTYQLRSVAPSRTMGIQYWMVN